MSKPTTAETNQFMQAMKHMRKTGDLNRVYRKVAKSVGIDPGQVREILSVSPQEQKRPDGRLRQAASKSDVSDLPTKPYSSFQAALKKYI